MDFDNPLDHVFQIQIVDVRKKQLLGDVADFLKRLIDRGGNEPRDPFANFG